MKSKEKHKKIKQIRRKQNCYLRCKVLWSATEGLHGSSICDALLAEAKISNLDMAIFIQHQVFQLEGEKKVQSNAHNSTFPIRN